MADFLTHFSCLLEVGSKDRSNIAWTDTNGWLARTPTPEHGKGGAQ